QAARDDGADEPFRARRLDWAKLLKGSSRSTFSSARAAEGQCAFWHLLTTSASRPRSLVTLAYPPVHHRAGADGTARGSCRSSMSPQISTASIRSSSIDGPRSTGRSGEALRAQRSLDGECALLDGEVYITAISDPGRPLVHDLLTQFEIPISYNS